MYGGLTNATDSCFVGDLDYERRRSYVYSYYRRFGKVFVSRAVRLPLLFLFVVIDRFLLAPLPLSWQLSIVGMSSMSRHVAVFVCTRYLVRRNGIRGFGGIVFRLSIPPASSLSLMTEHDYFSLD